MNIWVAGARPRTLPAAIVPVAVGTACAVGEVPGGLIWWRAAAAMVVALALQVATNYANDYSDGIRGTDADDKRVGPVRLVGQGLAAPVLFVVTLRTGEASTSVPLVATMADLSRAGVVRVRLEGLGTDLHPRTVSVRDLVGGRSGFPPQQTHEDAPVGTYWSAASLDRPATPVVVMFEDPSAGASAAFTAPLLVEFGASVFAIPLQGAGDGVHLLQRHRHTASPLCNATIVPPRRRNRTSSKPQSRMSAASSSAAGKRFTDAGR